MLTVRRRWITASLAMLLVGVATAQNDPTPQPPSEKIDPIELFSKLVDRYRALETYRDTVDAAYVTVRQDRPPHHVTQRFTCHVSGSALRE